MFITLVNMATRRRMPLFKYRGKYREVKSVELPALRKRHAELELQERNMLILRHPYLTVEQSQGHMKEFRNRMVHKELWNKERNLKFDKTYTWAEQLSHLRTTDEWE